MIRSSFRTLPWWGLIFRKETLEARFGLRSLFLLVLFGVFEHYVQGLLSFENVFEVGIDYFELNLEFIGRGVVLELDQLEQTPLVLARALFKMFGRVHFVVVVSDADQV